MARPFSVDRIWHGQTVVIIGNGPSLDLAQIRLIGIARLKQKCRVIAINDAAFVAWWADWLHGCDGKWWGWHHGVAERFPRERTTCDPEVPDGIAGLLTKTGDFGFDPDPSCIRTGFSGAYQAIHIAIHTGARRIILVGVDMQPGAQNRWFGDHPDGINPTREEYRTQIASGFWTLQETLAERKIQVVNASPGSALKEFPSMPLEAALQAWC